MATVVSYVEQKRKMIDSDGFRGDDHKVKRIRIKYTPCPTKPPLIDFTRYVSYNNKEESVEKQVVRRIKIKYNPPAAAVPPLMVSNNTKELSFNQKQNRKFIQLSRMLGNMYRKSYVRNQKLCLVLDLDHTLLHSVRIQDVSAEDQEYLNLRVSSMKDSEGNSLYKHFGRYTKLRPYTREFLKEVGKYFELFIYTMGTRDYAAEMGRLLDPQGVIFKPGTIVSRDDSTKENRKNLDVLAGPNEKNTIIIDDTKRVWEQNERNLIQIRKYNYFSEGGHTLNKDSERDEDKALETISGKLQDVHKRFFELFPVPTPAELDEYVRSIDVRPVLEAKQV